MGLPNAPGVTYVRLVDGPDHLGGNPLGVAPVGDDLAAASLLGVANLGFDGAAWDRLRTLGAADVLGVLAAMQPSSVPVTATAAANTAVVRTYAAVANQRHRLTMLGVSWSGAAATVGLLTITDGASVLALDVPLALNTPHWVPLPPGGIVGSVGTDLVITLAAGGAGAVGKLNTAKLTG